MSRRTNRSPSRSTSAGRDLAAMAFGLRCEWPLYTVYPASTLLFWLLYFRGWDPLTKLLLRRCGGPVRRYGQLTSISGRCWRANCNACLHSFTVVLLLVVMFCADGGDLWSRRLRPYYSPWGYSAMCVSLAYFSFAIPWQHRLYFYEKRRDVIEWPLVIHHVAVVLGALVYVLTACCALYGAVAFTCMEFTNWFFVPWTMLEQLGRGGTTPHQVIGVILVLSYLCCRIVVCSWQGVRFTRDLADFSGDRAEWAAVVAAYLIFLFALALSWIWMNRLYVGLRDGVKELLQQRRSASAKVQPQQPQFVPRSQPQPQPQPQPASPTRTRCGGDDDGEGSLGGASPGGAGGGCRGAAAGGGADHSPAPAITSGTESSTVSDTISRRDVSVE